MAKKKSNKGKGSYAVYKAESRAEVNRKKRLAKHLKAHPNDAQTLAAAKKPGTVRSAPNTKGNFKEQKSYYYEGNGMKYLMPEFQPPGVFKKK